MATAPIKSQALHNFSLPHLRWAHKNSPQSHYDHSPPPPSPPHSSLHHRRRRDSPLDPSKQPSSRTLRKPQPPSFSPSFTSSLAHQNQKTERNDDLVDEEKPWKLRPRKVVATIPPPAPSSATTSSSFRKSERDKEKLLQDEAAPASNMGNNGSSVVVLKSSRVVARGGGGAGGGGEEVVARQGFTGTERQQRKVAEEKRRLWISLSKEEIEDDVYALTGSRPSRRPKKRPRNVQKQLDNIFPGMYLVGWSADAYRVNDSSR